MAAIGVVGAGAWGTALAVLCARAGHRVTLWARNPAPIARARESPRLPGVRLPDAVEVAGTLPPAADAVVMATPVRHLRAALALPRPADAPLVLCMKGLEPGTALFPAEIVRDAGSGAAMAVLSGPNFAHEVARGLPAAAVLGCADEAVRRHLLPLLGSRTFRLYGSADPVGVQVGGAAKNVVAIAAGAVMGAGLGENARAALVARSLAEVGRLVAALGGSARTASGLSGLGDLLLTCTGPASRNYRLGVMLGEGVACGTAQAAIGAAVEGVDAAPALVRRSAGVSCPVIATVARVLDGALDVAGGVAALLDRAAADEE